MDPKWDHLVTGCICPICIFLLICPYQLTIHPVPPCHRLVPGCVLDGGTVGAVLGQCDQV